MAGSIRGREARWFTLLGHKGLRGLFGRGTRPTESQDDFGARVGVNLYLLGKSRWSERSTTYSVEFTGTELRDVSTVVL